MNRYFLAAILLLSGTGLWQNKGGDFALAATTTSGRISKSYQLRASKTEVIPEKWAPLPPTAWDDLSLIYTIENIQPPLCDFFEHMVEDYGDRATVSKRTKSLISLSTKVRQRIAESPNYCVDNVKDIAGLRLVFPDLQDLYRVADQIEQRYDCSVRKDFTSTPKTDGYRGIHYVVIYQGKPVEVQLQTERMNRWAVWSHDLLYKNSEVIESLVGPEKMEEFRSYALHLSEQGFLLDSGITGPVPSVPEGMAVLWDYAPGPTRKVMLPDGTPVLSPEATS